jgi:quinol monooxygenase YgiN
MSAQNPHLSRGVEVTIRTRQTHRRELLQTLEGLRDRLVAAETECECDVYEDLGEPNRFVWTEWWRRSESVDHAMNSQHFRTLLAAAKVLGTLESVRRLDRSNPSTDPPDE